MRRWLVGWAARTGGSPSEPILLTLRQLAALRGPDWKVLLDGQSGYAVQYDLAADPEEQMPEPARSRAPEPFQALEKALRVEADYGRSLPKRGEAGVSLDPETRTRLEELGYVERSDDE